MTRQRTVGKGRHERIHQKMRVLPLVSVLGAMPQDVKPGDVSNVFVFSVLQSLRPADERQTLARMKLSEGLASLLRPDGSNSEVHDTLLIVDQFEELFTHHLDRWRDRENFFKQMAESLTTYPELRLLLSMREDYIAELTPYRGLVWNLATGEQRFKVENSQLSITDAAFSPDGRMVLTIGDDQVVRLWNAESGAEFQHIEGHAGQVASVAWHPNSTSVALARSDSVVLVAELGSPSAGITP